MAYFGVEFTVAHIVVSVSLFADSVDFLEDASLNIFVAIALGWSAANRARLGIALAGILLIPGLATLWTAWVKMMSQFGIAAMNADAARQVWTAAHEEHRAARA